VALTAGSQVGPYEVISPLGAGGMGQVYRALDKNLRREVALKVLSDALANNADHLSRFRREAQVLASLNHQNIAAIYGFEATPEVQALVLELVEGPTLAERLAAGPLPVREALTLAEQIADALNAAHERGIIHRDLKPANIKITPSGRVKVLDFGLAKLIADANEPGAGFSDSPTITSPGTRPGVLLGTPAYMSPEQTRGQFVDTRTDVWAFGCVLFEMLTGKTAFAAPTLADTIARVLEQDPPLSALPPQIPSEIRVLLQRCFEKNPERRLRNLADVRVRLQGPIKTPAAVQPRGKRISSPWLFAGAAIVAVVLAVFAFLLPRGTAPHRAVATEYVPLTNFTDSAVQPSLSPDSRMLTFIRGNDGFTTHGEVYVKLLPNGDPVQLTHDGQDGLTKMSPKFSPDGSEIAYTRVREAKGWETWVVPTLGGEPRRMLANTAALTWIANKRVMFSEMRGKGILMGISTAGENGAEAHELYVPAAESGMAHRSYLSPDGKSVLVVEMVVAEGGWQPCRLVPYDGHSKGRQVGPLRSQCTEAAWSPDGKWMYFTANAGGGYHLWRQSYPDGPVEQITDGATEEEGIAVTLDGGSIISSVGAHQSTIWIHDKSGDRQVSAEGYAFVPSFSSDGRTLFYLSRAGSSPVWISGELWSFDLMSSARARVLPNFVMLHYDISADGKRIVFAGSDTTGKSGVWLASTDGKFPPRLISAGESQRAFFRPPGDILFQKKEGDSWFVYLANEDGTSVRKALPETVIFLFSVSPDGKWMVVDKTGELIAYPLSGGTPVLICSCAETGGEKRGHSPPQASWSPDGRFLYLRGDVASTDRAKILAIPLKAGEMVPPLPSSGIARPDDVLKIPGVEVINQSEAFPGPHPSLYAFTRTATLRNLYQIRIP
jgi:serine/threonine protein kinase/Tol biopolymer transport system component